MRILMNCIKVHNPSRTPKKQKKKKKKKKEQAKFFECFTYFWRYQHVERGFVLSYVFSFSVHIHVEEEFVLCI
jgi:hypothetical protein